MYLLLFVRFTFGLNSIIFDQSLLHKYNIIEVGSNLFTFSWSVDADNGLQWQHLIRVFSVTVLLSLKGYICMQCRLIVTGCRDIISLESTLLTGYMSFLLIRIKCVHHSIRYI